MPRKSLKKVVAAPVPRPRRAPVRPNAGPVGEGHSKRKAKAAMKSIPAHPAGAAGAERRLHWKVGRIGGTRQVGVPGRIGRMAFTESLLFPPR